MVVLDVWNRGGRIVPPILPSWFALAIAGASAAFWLLYPLPDVRTLPSTSATVPTEAGSETNQTAPKSLPVPDEAVRNEVVANVLFSPGRSPEQYIPEPEPDFEVYEPEPDQIYIEVEPEPEPLPPPEPPRLKMLGFIRDDGGPRALIVLLDEANEKWFAIGDQVQGWEVQSMSALQVTLSQNDTEFVVKLYD